MIDEEVERIEKMCEKYFQNIEEFTEMKSMYSMIEMINGRH